MFKKKQQKSTKSKKNGVWKETSFGTSQKVDLPDETTDLDVANNVLENVKKADDVKEMQLFAYTEEGNHGVLYNHGNKKGLTKYVLCLIEEDLVDIDAVENMIKVKKLKDVIQGAENIVDMLKVL